MATDGDYVPRGARPRKMMEFAVNAGTEGRIVQINISRGGVPKLPVAEARVTRDGLVGDFQSDTRNHGGPMRALCLFTVEEIERLSAEGHPVYPGAVGENVTLSGLPLEALTPGTCLALGDETLIEITSYASPCKTIRGAFLDGDFTRISPNTHAGECRVYARVLRGGVIHAGDAAHLLNESAADFA